MNMQGQNFNNQNQGNNLKNEIMKSGLVNLDNLFDDPKGRNNNNQNRFGNNNFRNNADDLFDL